MARCRAASRAGYGKDKVTSCAIRDHIEVYENKRSAGEDYRERGRTLYNLAEVERRYIYNRKIENEGITPDAPSA